MKFLDQLLGKSTLKLAMSAYFIYHGVFTSRVGTCRFEPTCSKYFITALEKHGILKGLLLSIKRICACHPFSNKPIVDLVP